MIDQLSAEKFHYEIECWVVKKPTQDQATQPPLVTYKGRFWSYFKDSLSHHRFDIFDDSILMNKLGIAMLGFGIYLKSEYPIFGLGLGITGTVINIFSLAKILQIGYEAKNNQN